MNGDDRARLGTVLVVDEDAGTVAFVTRALQDRGYRVLTADASAMLVRAREEHPDVILLDVNVPGLDGVEASRVLHADPCTAHIPIIAMSAGTELHTDAGRMAADDALAKPFHFGDLYAALARWMPRADTLSPEVM